MCHFTMEMEFKKTFLSYFHQDKVPLTITGTIEVQVRNVEYFLKDINQVNHFSIVTTF